MGIARLLRLHAMPPGPDACATHRLRRRNLGRKLLLFIIATAFTLLVLELIFRVAGIKREGIELRIDRAVTIKGKTSEPVLYGFNTNTIFISRYASNPRGYFEPDHSISHRHNSAGWRDVEHTLDKPAHVFRILGLGDSYLWGQGVKREDICLTRLTGLLEGAVPNKKVETINAGLPAMNTVDQRNQLLERGLAYDPNLVIVHFVLNDVEEKGGGEGPKVEFFEDYLVVSGSPDWLSTYSYFWSWIRQGIINEVRGRNYIQDCVASFDTDSVGWHNCQDALRDVKAICEGYDVRLLVVIFPFYHDLNGDYPFQPIHDTVSAFCKSQGINVLDLRDDYRDHRGPELWVHPTDQHPNEQAHEIAAKAIAAYLKDHADELLTRSENEALSR